jgi:hypothetical protein
MSFLSTPTGPRTGAQVVDTAGGDVVIEDRVSVFACAGAAGPINFRFQDGSEAALYFNLGQMVPLMVSHVLQAGTTATGIVGLKY